MRQVFYFCFNRTKTTPIDMLILGAYNAHMSHPSRQPTSRSKRVNITMPPELHERSLNLVESFYFGDFSNLIQHLLRKAIFDPSTLLSISPTQTINSPETKLKALEELQKSVGLTPEKAASWKRTVREGRR